MASPPMEPNGSASTTPGEGWSNGDLAPSLFPVTRDGRIQLYSRQRRWINLHESWTRIGSGSTELSKRTQDSAAFGQVKETADEQARSVRALIAQLCEQFYRNGWATGTGGGASIRIRQEDTWRVFVAPSGIQKEDMVGDDVFEMDMRQNIVVPPRTPNLRPSACTPLWYVIYNSRPDAQCAIHTHSIYAQLATMIHEDSKTLKLTHLEMLKGVQHAYDDTLEIPIIDNRPTEDLLAAQLQEAVDQYPKCCAVLVRRHGLYVWGDSWEQAKTHCESLDYLFHSALVLKKMGIDAAQKPPAGTFRDDEPPRKKPKLLDEGFRASCKSINAQDLFANQIPLLPRDARYLVLDIEGCTTAISYVHDKMFPYVLKHIDEYTHSLKPEQINAYVKTLRVDCQTANVQVDAMEDPKKEVIQRVRALMVQDAKVSGLKQLQGDLWKQGFDQGQLKAHVYSDLKPMLQWMHRYGVRVCIYSSGSVDAQKLLFGHSIVGNLLEFLGGHFDIATSGNKKEAESYANIALALKVNPSQIVFCSDSEAELVAAREAGIGHPIMTVREGNAPLTSVGKQFTAIYSLMQLCGE